MVYFISSNTKWISEKKYSIFFRYINPGEKLFGNIRLENSLIMTSFDDIKASFFNRKLEVINQAELYSGKTIDNNIIYSKTVLTQDTNYFEEYKERAFNIFEYFGQKNDYFWSDFANLIRLTFLEMKKSKSHVEAIFINASFFPNALMQDLDNFYKTLFSNLNQYPNETFVIIVDPNSNKRLANLGKFLNEHSKDFSDGIIVRVEYNKAKKTNTYENPLIMFSIYDSHTIEDFLDFTEKFRETDIKSLIDKRFNQIEVKYAEKDRYYHTYKKRLTESSFSSLNTDKMEFASFKSVEKFFEKYLEKKIKAKCSPKEFRREKIRFFQLFQRHPLGNCQYKSYFKPNSINPTCTWSKITRKMNAIKLVDIKDQDSYNQIQYFCGKKQSKMNNYSIPANNYKFKEFIFKIGICENLCLKEVENLLKSHGFIICSFSFMDLMYIFQIIYIQKNNLIDTDKKQLFNQLKNFITSSVNPLKLDKI